jgi:SAM-dependent methyltransferase
MLGDMPKQTERMVIRERTADGLRCKEFREAATSDYWDKLWDAEDSDYQRDLNGHLPHQLLWTIGKTMRPPARVLEAGCGTGHFTVAMHHRGFEAYGIDYAERVINRLKVLFPEINFSFGDVRRSPYTDGFFDAVYSPGVCEHYEEGPEEILQDAHRILRSGGLLYVSTPHYNWLRRLRWSDKTDGSSFYQYLFTKKAMIKILERLNFVVVGTLPYGVWATVADEWQILKKIPLGKAAGIFNIPGLRDMAGSTCIWIARKP